MKQCPQCLRTYSDETLNFCLDDGEWLAVDDEPATAILTELGAAPSAVKSSESPTRFQNHPTDKTAILPAETKVSIRKSFAHDRGFWLAAGVIALVILVVFGYRYVKQTSVDQIDSIAVLPFENRSGSTDADYLSDGLADSLIYRLSQLPNLKVSPTSSVLQYKGKGFDVAQIAKELNVDAVMSGRLVQIGDSLNISVQLTDARTKKLIWAEQYDRKMADLMATQREIAVTIAQKLQLRLSGDEKGITKKYTSSNDAYQLYLKGRYYWAKRTKDDMFKAIDAYKQAIALDANFALAYAALAEVYNSMAKDPDVAPGDAVPFAKTAATHALELDATLPEAHSAFGDSLAVYDWNWTQSEQEFKRAIELDPNISYIHLAYSGSYLGPIGKLDEAVTEAERAVEMEPLSLINNAVLISSYLNARRYDKAIAQGRKSYDLDPNFPLSRHWLGMAYVATQQYDKAIFVSLEVPPDSPSRWLSVVVLGHAYAKMGKRPEAEQQIAELRDLARTRYIRPYYIASIYAALGNKDKAFAELERSYQERDVYLNRVNSDPFMDPLRDDPRFKNLLKRINLVE